ASYWKPLPGDEGGHESEGVGGDTPQTMEVRANPLIASRINTSPKPANIPDDQDIIRMYMPAAEPVDEEEKKGVDSSCKPDGQGSSSDAADAKGKGRCSPRADSTGVNSNNLTTHTPVQTGGMRPTLPNGVKKNAGGLKICSR
ncbi:unnamed protein product, partial [Laminaria digitata]